MAINVKSTLSIKEAQAPWYTLINTAKLSPSHSVLNSLLEKGIFCLYVCIFFCFGLLSLEMLLLNYKIRSYLAQPILPAISRNSKHLFRSQ